MPASLPRPHWISRCLTEPWEVHEKRRRQLVFFDLATGRVGKPVSSKRLFREDRGRREDVERRLNELIETPLMQARAKLLAPGQVEVADWRTGRAVALMLLTQAQRNRARETQNDDALAALLLMRMSMWTRCWGFFYKACSSFASETQCRNMHSSTRTVGCSPS